MARSVTVYAQGLPPIVGAILFALFPAGMIAGNIKLSYLLRNWMWVCTGNLLGSLLYVAVPTDLWSQTRSFAQRSH